MLRSMLVIGKLAIFLSALPVEAKTLLRFQSGPEKLKLEELFKTDDIIWGFEFLPDQRILFTEKAGKLRIYDPKKNEFKNVDGLPKIENSGQGGLLDVALHPNFEKNKWVYLTFSYAEGEKNTTAIFRGQLEGNSLKNGRIIFKALPLFESPLHFGSRLAFDDKGFLFFCMGERNHREFAQDLSVHLGKVMRLTDEGGVPTDNPLVGKKNVKPEIWTWGHRNPQGLFWWKEREQLWETEHGPKGGDEINIIKPGLNYGWPVITYGREYHGPKIGETHKDGMVQPVKYYVPSIATSGATAYTGNKIPSWKGNVFVGALALTHLSRVPLEGEKALAEEKLLADWGQRIRDVKQGPDEFLYLSTDTGYMVRIEPEK